MDRGRWLALLLQLLAGVVVGWAGVQAAHSRWSMVILLMGVAVILVVSAKHVRAHFPSR